MSEQALQPYELMQRFVNFFEGNRIAYWVVGSMATIAYGEPRMTIDIDIVADLKSSDVAPLCTTFTDPEFYLSEAAIREAIARRFEWRQCKTINRLTPIAW